MKLRKWLAPVLAAATATAIFASSSTPAQGATDQWFWSRPIPHIYQDTNWNCLPASATNQLASAGGTVDSTTQDMLATQFQTVEAPGGGTLWSNAVGPLDNLVGPNYAYDVRYVGSGTELFTEVKYQIDHLGDGLMVSAIWDQLPWNSGSTSTTGHVMLIYGYNAGQATAQGGAFYVWDPWPGHGYEWIGAGDLWNALQTDNTNSKYAYELERVK